MSKVTSLLSQKSYPSLRKRTLSLLKERAEFCPLIEFRTNLEAVHQRFMTQEIATLIELCLRKCSKQTKNQKSERKRKKKESRCSDLVNGKSLIISGVLSFL